MTPTDDRARVGAEKQGAEAQYALKIDEQTEKFIDTKQKLSYFLITASVAVTAFLLTFVFDKHPGRSGGDLWLAVSACVMGLATAGASLLSVHWELRSYGMHIAARYKKLEWNDLPKETRDRWDRVNARASYARNVALALLFIEIALAVAFFVAFALTGVTRA